MINTARTQGLIDELRRIELSAPANEAEVETKILLHVFKLLGYSDSDRADKPSVLMYFGRERKTKYPDFVLYDGSERSVSNALVTVEAKDDSRSIDEAVAQAKSYALWAGTPFYLTCNGRTLRAVQFMPATNEHRLVEVHVPELTTGWEALSSFLSRSQTIVAKERLAYATLYLPDIERLPAREFFSEYLRRVAERFSTATGGTPAALDPSPSRFHIPRIAVTVRFEGRPLEDFDEVGILRLALEDHGRILVSGSAGSGKSTLLRRVAHRAASSGTDIRPDVLPVFVRLAGEPPESVLEAFAVGCTEMGIRVLPNIYRESLKRAHLILLLDGLDEMELTELNRKKLAKLLNDSQSHTVIVSARQLGADALHDLPAAAQFESAEVAPLSDQAVDQIFKAYLGERSDDVFSLVPLPVRDSLRSPLMAMMAIRVAQLGSWTVGSVFDLFAKYVEALDAFFNAATVRGAHEFITGEAVEDVTFASWALASSDNVRPQSLESLETTLTTLGRPKAVRSLVNIGLLTSSGDSARFVHQSFADFGLARHILISIRANDPASLSSTTPSAGAYDLIHSELTGADHDILAGWVQSNEHRLQRRVFQLLRRGCNTPALIQVRAVWRSGGLSGIIKGAAQVLAANGDVDFLLGQERHIHGATETMRSQILAKVLSNSGRPEYLDAVVALELSKRRNSYSAALVRIVLNGAAAGRGRLIAAYRLGDTKKRTAMAKTLAQYRRLPGIASLVGDLLSDEQDPQIVLLLVYAARHALYDIEELRLRHAAKRLGELTKTQPYEWTLASVIQELIVSTTAPTPASIDIALQCERIIDLGSTSSPR